MEHRRGRRTYGGDAFHAQDERVGEHISRVGQGVLFPQLPEEIRHGSHAAMVPHEIPFEEEMYRAACQMRYQKIRA